MQHHAANQLHVEVPHVEGAAPGFAAQRKRLNQKIVERLAFGQPFLELLGPQGELGIRKLLHLRFQRIDRLDPRLEALELALVLGPDDLAHRNLKEISHAVLRTLSKAC